MKKNWLILFLYIITITSMPALSIAQEEYTEEITCPANSYLSGDQCLCDPGYIVPAGGSSCVPESQACNAFGPSHLVGTDCVCNDGYAIIDGGGVCQSLSAACAGYNAVWSDAAGDCVCPAGWHEDTAANICLQDPPPEPEPTSNPTITNTNLPTADNPIINPVIPDEQLPVITQIELPPTDNNNFQIIDDLMQPVYDQYPPALKTFVIEAQPQLEQEAAKPYAPQVDLYNIKFNEPLNFKDLIGDTLPLVDPTTATTAQDQLATISQFSDNKLNEQALTQPGIIETFVTNTTDKKYIQELIQYHQQVATANQELTVKTGVDRDQFATNVEMEDRLKWQIANLEKILRYNHMRIIEVTSHLRQLGPDQTQIVFEQMPSDYQEFFDGQSGSSDFEEAEEGLEFNRAFANITGATQQLKDLKATLTKSYPTGWRDQYLDLPPKPQRDTIKQQIDQNVFLYMQNKINN